MSAEHMRATFMGPHRGPRHRHHHRDEMRGARHRGPFAGRDGLPFLGRSRTARRGEVRTAVLILLLVVVRAVLYIALTPLAPTDAPTPADLLLTTLTLIAVVWLVLDLTERRRMARPRLRLLPTDAGAMAKLAGASTGSRAGG